MSDFLGGSFDFNGDGMTDSGEEFIGHEIYKDVINGFQRRPARKIDGFTIFIMVIVGWWVLNWIADLLY